MATQGIWLKGLVQDRPGKSGRELVSSRNHLLTAPVHVFTNFVRGAYTVTRFYQICLDQSDTALKVDRVQDWCLV